jgi:hypothetical protein
MEDQAVQYILVHGTKRSTAGWDVLVGALRTGGHHSHAMFHPDWPGVDPTSDPQPETVADILAQTGADRANASGFGTNGWLLGGP